MIIVGSITHNPDELAGKIPPRADLGDCQGLARGFKVRDGVTMIDGGKFDGPKAYKDAKVCNMLTIFEMHRRFHESKNITFNTMYPGRARKLGVMLPTRVGGEGRHLLRNRCGKHSV